MSKKAPFRIIHTVATTEQYKEDYPKLVKQYKKALKENPLWGIFGGTITVNGRSYQVA